MWPSLSKALKVRSRVRFSNHTGTVPLWGGLGAVQSRRGCAASTRGRYSDVGGGEARGFRTKGAGVLMASAVELRCALPVETTANITDAERRCADTAKWRAFRTFRPTIAPRRATRSGNKARAPFTQSDHFRNVRWITRPPQGARISGIALSCVGGHPTTALPMALFGAPRCHNSRSKPKPRHLIGKKIILILLTKPMHRENASRRY